MDNKKYPYYEVRKIKDLKDMLAQSVKLYHDKAAFLTKPVTGKPYVPITYAQFNEDVNAFGTALCSLGLKDGSVAVIGKNRYEWYVTYMSVVNGVGVIVPLDKELPVAEIKNLIKRSDANAIVFSSEKTDEISQIKRELSQEEPEREFIFIGMDVEEDTEDYLSFKKLLEKGRELLASGDRTYIDAEIDSEDMKILLFTSGTTAESKAVALSHRNICYNLEGMCKMVYIGPGDTFLSILPLHHTYECTCGFLCQIYRGCTIAQCEGLRYIVSNMKEAKTTMILTVPLVVESFHKKVFSKENEPKLRKAIKISNFLRKLGIDVRKKLFAKVHNAFGGHLRMIITGGAAIDPQLVKDFQDIGLNMIQGYGLTECSPILALNRDVYYKNHSAGLPLPGVDVRIVDQDENGIGEIIGKGDNVMLGYFKDEKATNEAIIDGFFHTGDLGYIDEDGFVVITGRKKNVIVTNNGKNIFPEEIETLLNRSDYILESVVYGRKDPDKNDIVVVAEIVADMDKFKAEFGDDVSEEKIREVIKDEVWKVNHQLVTYKYIRDFNVRDTEFEKTSSRKIKRGTVVEGY